MSNAVLPALPGLQFPVTKTPIWSTKIQAATSGKETRLSYWSYPIWKYSIGYEFLRSNALAELQSLAGFFNARQGSFDSFLFNDPDDNAVVNQGIGTGDGVTTSFQLVRAYGGYVEPVQALQFQPSVLIDGQAANMLMNGSYEQIKFAGRPAGWAAYTAAGATYVNPAARSGAAASGLRASVGSNGPLGLYTDSNLVDGSIVGGVRGGWQPNTTYTVSFYAKKVGGALFTGCGLAWNVAPVSSVVVANPTLTTAYQRYVFTITTGAAVEGQGRIYISILGGASVVAVNDEIHLDDVQVVIGSAAPPYVLQTQTYTINGTGLVTFDVAPTVAQVVGWTGSYFWRVRFLEDQIELEKFMRDLWSCSTLEFQSLK